MLEKTRTEAMPFETGSPDVSAGMTESGSSAGGLAPKRNSLLQALDRLTLDQFGQVVEDALKAPRKGAVKAARQSLDAAIDACEFIEIKGVRPGKASKASPAQLKLPVIEECDRYDNVRMLGALLRTWRACKTPLREKVSAHLEAAGIAAKSADFKEGFYHSLWRTEDWERHVASLLASDDGSDSGETEDSGLSAAETRLMLSLVSGASPAGLGELSAAKFDEPALASFLERLWKYHSHESIWEEMDSFIAELGELNDAKGREMIESRITTGKERIEELDSMYRESLAYLECDLGRIRSAIDENVELLLFTGDDFYPDLLESLREYESVRHKGCTKTEDDLLVTKRAPLEDEIVDLVTRWESEIGKRQMELGEQEAEPAETEEDPTRDELPENGEILELRNRLKAETSKRKELQSRYESQTAELRKLRLFVRNAESRIKGFQEENLDFMERLREAEEAEPQKSAAAVSEGKGDYLVMYPPQFIEDVKDAVSQARRTFENELVFALNAKSQQNSAFDKPDEVFKALAWLATIFRISKLNPDVGVNLNEALEENLRQAVRPNWFFTPRQSPTATGKYPDAYTASHQGKKYDLHEHIGRGNSHKAKGNIRIAFAWDEDQGKLIVGYIGRHQPTGRS